MVTGDQFFPSIAVNAASTIRAFYYSTQLDATKRLINSYYVQSTDDGVTWSAPYAVAGAFDRLRDAIFDPEPLRDVWDLAHFTGREWIIRKIDQYIATHDRGYVVVQAEAGIGKAGWLRTWRSRGLVRTILPGLKAPVRRRRPDATSRARGPRQRFAEKRAKSRYDLAP